MRELGFCPCHGERPRGAAPDPQKSRPSRVTRAQAEDSSELITSNPGRRKWQLKSSLVAERAPVLPRHLQEQGEALGAALGAGFSIPAPQPCIPVGMGALPGHASLQDQGRTALPAAPGLFPPFPSEPAPPPGRASKDTAAGTGGKGAHGGRQSAGKGSGSAGGGIPACDG